MDGPEVQAAIAGRTINGALALFADGSLVPAGLDDTAVAACAAGEIRRRTGRALPVLFARQVHSRLSYVFGTEKTLPAGPVLVGACDALITAERDVALLVRTADCLPVALAGDGVAAMVHAGWRGLAADILGSVVRRIHVELGVPPERLAAVVGVGVGPCHYPVGDDVRAGLAALDTAGAPWHVDENRVDLAAWAGGRLQAIGLHPGTVEVLPGCTACDQRFHSFRRDGPRAGRQWSAVMLDGDGGR